MFIRVKPSIIFSIWPGPLGCVDLFILQNVHHQSVRLPRAWSGPRPAAPDLLPASLTAPHVTVSGLRSHLNSRLTRRVMSPFLLYSHVHMSVPTNQRPGYRSCDRPWPIRSQTQSAMTPPMSDPICPDTGTPGHIRSGSQYKCTVHLCLSPANPRLIYGLNPPPDASTGADFRIVFLVRISPHWHWFSYSVTITIFFGIHLFS